MMLKSLINKQTSLVIVCLFVCLGKLEALSILLQKLRAEGRRVLIFTQMTSMLNILEVFLDRHHFTYVRLDESLTLQEKQVPS